MAGVPENNSVFIIGEIGINHNGDLDLAKELVSETADASADAAKFQLWNREEFVSDPDTMDDVKKWEFSEEEWRELRDFTEEQELVFFASAFDEASVDFLIDLGAQIVKIASGDITHIPLLEHVSEKDTDVIMSTGASTMTEISQAVDAVEPPTAQLHLLECVSSYPAAIEDLNLAAMQTYEQAFDVPVGFSDHTSGTVAPAVAVGMGASIVEKHVTLDRDMEGPDHSLSLEPDELAEMVETIRAVNAGRGDGVKRPIEGESEFAEFARRGLKAKAEIAEGETLKRDNIKIARPDTGISPAEFDRVVGQEATTAIEQNEPITWDYV